MLTEYKILRQIAATLIILVAFSFPACGSMHVSSDDDLQLIREKSFNISPGKNLCVDVSSGDVIVTYWDKAEVYVKILEMKMQWKKWISHLKEMKKMVKVIAKKKSSVSSWFSNISLEIEIKVPSEFNVDVNTSGGDIKYGGIKWKC